MGYYWKLLLLFGCGCLGVWVMGLLANGIPTSRDYIILSILIPIIGVISILICYIFNRKK
jgi:hypothetical protein